MIKQYNLNKGRKWVINISQDQLYQVFQCFSEDQIYFFEDMEFAVMEMRLEDLKRERLKADDSQCGTSDINTESYIGDPSQLAESSPTASMHRSESSTVKMYEYIEERRKQQQEQAAVDVRRRDHNDLVAKRFQLDLFGAHGIRADEPSVFLGRNRRNPRQRFCFSSGLYADGNEDDDDGSNCVGGLSLRESMRTKRTEAKEGEMIPSEPSSARSKPDAVPLPPALDGTKAPKVPPIKDFAAQVSAQLQLLQRARGEGHGRLRAPSEKVAKTRSLPQRQEARKAKSGVATPQVVKSGQEKDAIMEFEDENSDEPGSDPVVVSAQQSARKGGTEISIEEGKSEMAVSRNDATPRNDNAPEGLPSSSPLPQSFTSSPRRMYVENASDSRYNSG